MIAVLKFCILFGGTSGYEVDLYPRGLSVYAAHVSSDQDIEKTEEVFRNGYPEAAWDDAGDPEIYVIPPGAWPIYVPYVFGTDNERITLYTP